MKIITDIFGTITRFSSLAGQGDEAWEELEKLYRSFSVYSRWLSVSLALLLLNVPAFRIFAEHISNQVHVPWLLLCCERFMWFRILLRFLYSVVGKLSARGYQSHLQVSICTCHELFLKCLVFSGSCPEAQLQRLLWLDPAFSVLKSKDNKLKMKIAIFLSEYCICQHLWPNPTVIMIPRFLGITYSWYDHFSRGRRLLTRAQNHTNFSRGIQTIQSF